ncbi:AGE family epimerase/isomerase [Halomarina halobia]|uniref:AGE family epimerase/isomerase n=1 Tax=Halomarina halobia TaxID=3033386 RepID=A0ABD6AD37_9EURY|nr:AGE family epimerase/isomerase [Halomarina sp. PSR21]
MSQHTHRDPSRLRDRLVRVLNHYYPDCIDTRFGGYVAQLDERDGHVYDGLTKHLVATCRAIHNFSVGIKRDGPTYCRATAEHGLHFLRHVHWDETHEGYNWILAGREPRERTRYCYGHAFAVLAAATAVDVGLPSARKELERATSVLDDRFYEPAHGLYADVADPEWEELGAYRGQNANMHACEAMLAAYEATGEKQYLNRAAEIADALVCENTDNGCLWEHFDETWTPDYEYNWKDPDHQFRPWGYQPGHHVEWTKLLLHLHDHRPQDWLVETATDLFETAVETGWDDEYGGFYYTVDREDEPVSSDKYGWAVAEGIGAAARLAVHDRSYLDWYDRLWTYADRVLVNPRNGNWYESVSREGELPDQTHDVAVEPGYHPISNICTAIDVFEANPGLLE